MRLPTLLFGLHAVTAFAHPGAHHESTLSTLTHLLTEPDHLAMAAIAVLLAFSVRRQLRRRASLKRSRDHDSR